MRHRPLSQSNVIAAIRSRIEQVLARPHMFAADDDELRGLLVGYVDALAIACSGHSQGFLYGEIPQIDATKSSAENMDAIMFSVRDILAKAPTGRGDGK